MSKKGMHLASFALCLTIAAAAQAQPFARTWVSGAGDDTNPCTRALPCKTFAGALAKTNPGGEIDALDSGSYGAVVIDRAISIVADGNIAGIMAPSGQPGVTVNAGANDVVVLRGLTIEGLGAGSGGIRFNTGAALFVERSYINNLTYGIDFQPSAASELYVKDTTVRNNGSGSTGGGVYVKPGASGSALASFDLVRFERNVFGLRVEDNARAKVRNSVSAGNFFAGLAAISNANKAQMVVEDSVSTENGTGVRSAGPQALVILSNVHISHNNVGLVATGGGSIISYGNNRISLNGTDGSPTGTQAQQ